MSARHAFEESIITTTGQSCQQPPPPPPHVSHPAEPDLARVVPSDPGARPYSIGSVAMCALPGTLKPSLTFRGTGFPRDETMVEMDWCLIGPVPNGRNFVSVPSFRMDGCVAVESTAAVEGNTEVYAMARTSGYSLGFTSDVPGLLKIGGRRRREWTVRQYSPPPGRRGRSHKRAALAGRPEAVGDERYWVPGDSGAWLIRRSDNALMGLIWARSHDCGDPWKRERLAYFTPVVDILADVQQQRTDGQKVALPVYSKGDLAQDGRGPSRREAVELDMFRDPRSACAREALREHHEARTDLILSHFVGGSVPASGAVLDRPQRVDGPSATGLPYLVGLMESSIMAAGAPTTTPPRSDGGGSISTLPRGLELDSNPDLLFPALSMSSSVGSSSSMVDENSEVASVGHGVWVRSELDSDEDVVDAEEVRA